LAARGVSASSGGLVSRGSNAHDVLGVAAIVGLQSIAYHELYPPDEKIEHPSAAQ